MIIRRFQKKDLPELVSMNREAYGFTKSEPIEEIFEEVRWWGDESLFQWYFDQLNKSGGDILIAESEGRIIGQLDFVTEEDTTYVIWLLVRVQYRGGGVAKSLLEHLIKTVDSQRILTEAEDEVTEHIYGKLAKNTRILQNWWLDLNFIASIKESETLIFPEGEPKIIQRTPREYQIKLGTFDQLESDILDVMRTGERIIGEYGLQIYDLNQLIGSIDTIAQPYIWGETTPFEILAINVSETQIVAIVTQYSRIYVSKTPSEELLKEFVSILVDLLYRRGFESVDLQVIKSNLTDTVLNQLGFTLIEEDPQYDLRS